MPRQSTIFGGGGSDAYGVWSNGLVAKTAGLMNAAETARPDIFQARRKISGFLRDGDSLEFFNGVTIRYRNPAGATLWNIAPSDINGAATTFGGMFIDTTGTLLYVIAAVGAAGNFTLYLATIDIAGTINNIATMNPAVMAGSVAWDIDASVSQGRGEIFPIFGTTLAMGINQDTPVIYFFIFDYTTGAIVDDTVLLDPILETGNVLGLDKNKIVLMTSGGSDFGFFGIDGSVIGTNLGFVNGTLPTDIRSAMGLGVLSNNSLRYMTRLDSEQVLTLGTTNASTVVSRIQTLDTLAEVTDALLFQYMGANL